MNGQFPALFPCFLPSHVPASSPLPPPPGHCLPRGTALLHPSLLLPCCSPLPILTAPLLLSCTHPRCSPAYPQSAGSLVATTQARAAGIGSVVLLYLLALVMLLATITYLIGKVRAGLLNQESRVSERPPPSYAVQALPFRVATSTITQQE